MSFTFATVAEGATDHAILQNILLGIFKEHGVESGDITAVQPLIDETGKQIATSHGGWQQVLRWLNERRYQAAFQFNDFVIVHIDTDSCEEAGFDIQKTVNGVARTPEELVALVKTKLIGCTGESGISAYPNRFHYAIAVHQIECWLLPLWGKAQESDEVLNCKQRVDNGLGRAKRSGLKKDDVRTYAAASAEFRKLYTIVECCGITDEFEVVL